MLAKLKIFVPFELIIPLDDKYKIYEYEDDGYKIFFEIPSSSGKPVTHDTPEHPRINGKPAILADVITITFQKESFDRKNSSEIDPPVTLIQKCLNSFLVRLKYALNAPQIKFFDLSEVQWILLYLNDDGSELEKIEGLFRRKLTVKYTFSWICCDQDFWEHIISLPENFQPPAWHALLIDSRGALPHIGTAIVLAATALEVLIADILDRLAKESVIPGSLWNWINDRKNWQKEPSVDEQYDVLLKVLTGHSLKEDSSLWEGQKNLRKARNSFVHEGIAKLGQNTVTVKDTLKLIGLADAITTKIREWLPEQYRWPIFNHTFKLEFDKAIVKPSNSLIKADAPSNGTPVS